MNEKSRTLAVSNPGGLSRHYRVQFRDIQKGIWKHSAVFSKIEMVEPCVQELQRNGFVTRVIHYRLPVAA